MCNFLLTTNYNISFKYHSFNNSPFLEILPIVTVYSANNHKQQLWDHHLLSAVTLPLVMSQPENYSHHNLYTGRLQPSFYTILYHVDQKKMCAFSYQGLTSTCCPLPFSKRSIISSNLRGLISIFFFCSLTQDSSSLSIS